MTARKGDIVLVRSEKSGDQGRRGLVLGVLGSMLTIRWDDDTESMFIPGPGTLTVVGKEHNLKRVKATR